IFTDLTPMHYSIRTLNRQEQIGTTWILTKIGVRKSNFDEDDSFFVFRN
ncbi:2359_t:CDS:1, partial [Acaulospora morrowiae]